MAKIRCPNCNGDGEIHIRGNHSSIYTSRKCYKCMGSGEIDEEEEEKEEKQSPLDTTSTDTESLE